MKKIIISLALAVLSVSSTSFAQTSDQTQAAWVPKFEWSGDARYRIIRAQERNDDIRYYQQLRLRLGLKADVNDSTVVVTRLSTNTSATSGNQVMGEQTAPAFQKRFFGLDLGYIQWKAMDDLRFWIGRTANPFWSPGRAQVLYDVDLSFEGGAVKWEPMWTNSGAFVNFGAFTVSENYTSAANINSHGSDRPDTSLLGLELGYIMKGEDWTWTSHIGQHHFLGLKNKSIQRVGASSATSKDTFTSPLRYRGNEVYLSGGSHVFTNDFLLSQLGTEWKNKLGAGEYSIFGEAIRNNDTEDLALETGLTYKISRYTVGYTYISKETDSVLGAFTDSDTAMGFADSVTHRLALSVNLAKNANAGVTHWFGERGADSTPRDYELTYLDLAVSF